MKKVLILLLSLGIFQQISAEDMQETINSQAMEIKHLKRALSVKEQELKILLITIKNSKQESMLHSTGQHLEFTDVNNVSATRVVVKPSMLSETAIKEIDHSEDIDTENLDEDLEVQTQLVGEPEAVEPLKTKKQEPIVASESKDEDTMVVQEKIVIKEAKAKKIEKLTYMKPSTFALVVDTNVFDKLVDGEGEPWLKGKRFTSNKRRGEWIQVTGEISNGKWNQVHKQLWIDASCVKKVR